MPAAAAPPTPDPRAILSALGLPPPEDVQRATGGADTLVWRVQTRGATFALRLLRPGEEGRCRREVAAITAAAAKGLPVCTVRAEGRWEGRPALLMDWCPGETLGHAVFARPAAAGALGRRFGEVQAALHAVTAPRELNTGWLDAGGEEAAPLRARLADLPARTDALIHLDYHPLNVLTDGARITGVIDWANAGAGDPRADLARTLSILHLFYRQPGIVSHAVDRFERGWREGYARAAGVAVDADLALFFAWSGLAMVQDQAGKQDPAFYRRAHAWGARWATRGGCRL